MWKTDGEIVVTGSLGRVGRAVCEELEKHSIPWRGVDYIAEPEFTASGRFAHVRYDLCDYGAAIEALAGASAVIHSAAIAFPSFEPDQKTYRDNSISSYNVFSAALLHGLETVIWLSSEEVYGHPFGDQAPAYLPIDENHPLLLGNSYALAKSVIEQQARYFGSKRKSRFLGIRSTVVQEEEDYKHYPGFAENPASRIWSLWSYIDARDLARACRLALTSDLPRASVVNIAASDTVVDIPSRELANSFFPDVELRWPTDASTYSSFCDISAAKKLIGFTPEISWRRTHSADEDNPTRLHASGV